MKFVKTDEGLATQEEVDKLARVINRLREDVRSGWRVSALVGRNLATSDGNSLVLFGRVDPASLMDTPIPLNPVQFDGYTHERMQEVMSASQ